MSTEEETQVAESAETTTTDANEESYEQDDSTGEGESEASTEGSEQRSTETPDQKRARLERQLKQLNKKHPKESQEDNQEGGKEESKESSKIDDERYNRLELKTEGITSKKQQDIVLEYIKEAKLVGRDVEPAEALKSLVVKEAIADLQKKTSAPAPSKRTGTGATDTFEYWVGQAKKGNFPKGDKAMMAKLKKARIFTQ